MDGTRGALASAFATALALGEINIGQVVLHSDGFKRTSFRALATTNTGGTAILAGSGTLFFIDTGHEHSSAQFSFETDFNHFSRTSLGASTATHTFLLIHYRQTSCFVNMNGIKLASLHTIATAKAAERTSALTGINRGRELA